MAKPEWGEKRQCKSCNAKFYDLQRSPIICPKCNAVLEIEEEAPVAVEVAAKPVAEAEAKDVELEEVDSEVEPDDDDISVLDDDDEDPAGDDSTTVRLSDEDDET